MAVYPADSHYATSSASHDPLLIPRALPAVNGSSTLDRLHDEASPTSRLPVSTTDSRRCGNRLLDATGVAPGSRIFSVTKSGSLTESLTTTGNESQRQCQDYSRLTQKKMFWCRETNCCFTTRSTGSLLLRGRPWNLAGRPITAGHLALRPLLPGLVPEAQALLRGPHYGTARGRRYNVSALGLTTLGGECYVPNRRH